MFVYGESLIFLPFRDPRGLVAIIIAPPLTCVTLYLTEKKNKFCPVSLYCLHLFSCVVVSEIPIDSEENSQTDCELTPCLVWTGVLCGYFSGFCGGSHEATKPSYVPIGP